MAYDALTVSKYFLSVPDEEAGISNLKLQKLLYFAQGYYLALHGRALFDDKIYAWKHGPVVKSVYTHYSHHNGNPIPSEDVAPAALTADDVTYLDEIYRTYGKFSAWALREMTHREGPWLEYYQADVQNVEIPIGALQMHFSKHVKKQKQKSA